MVKTISQLKSGVIFIGLIALLSGCGGGGSDAPSGSIGLAYPSCSLGVNGTNDVAGCWISEACGSGGETGATYNAEGVRYLADITQDSSGVNGAIEHYYMRYNNDRCEGEPFALLDMKQELANQGFEVVQTYEIPGFEVCTDQADLSNDPASIACTAIDITNDAKPLGQTTGSVSVGFGAYDDGIVNSRLCLTGNTYKGFDPADASDFAIGIDIGLLDVRNTDLDYLNCMTRFYP